jgi:hypothetical protein
MTKPTKNLTGAQEAALRSKEPTHGTPLHKLPEPKRRAVSWGLSAERIKARKPYCADPDVHGAECVCLTVPRDRKRRGAAERIEDAKDRAIAAATQQPKIARSIPTLVDLMATCPGIDTTERTTGRTYRQLLQMLRECL